MPKTRDLITSKDGKTVFSIFGPSSFSNNREEINETYLKPDTDERISFIEPTISESISLISQNFKDMKKTFEYHSGPHHYNLDEIYLGRVVRTMDGIYTNTDITAERDLTKLLNDSEKTNGIYLINDKIAFIPYDSFEPTVMNPEDFSRSALARGLEHTSEPMAENFSEIVSAENSLESVAILKGWGVSMGGFNPYPVRGTVNVKSFKHQFMIWDENEDAYSIPKNLTLGILKDRSPVTLS